MRVRTAILSILLAALAGCAGCDSVPPDALEDCDTSLVFPGAVKTDILFVIDDSGSMGDEQTLLQNGLDSFIQTLSSSTVSNQFQIGVTTTSVANYAGTTVPPDGDLVGPILVSSSATLVADFRAQVAVGISGSPREQPFAAARKAIEKSAFVGSPNYGLLRPGARLAVVFLTDEDDCSGPYDATIQNNGACQAAKLDPSSSLTTVAAFASFLSGPLDGEVRDVVVAAIVGVEAGTLAPSCGGAQCSNKACNTAIDSGDRFIDLVGRFSPTRTRLASICDASFEQSLRDFASAMASQTLPLEGAVADYRMLVARVTKPGVGTIGCTIASVSSPPAERSAADALYKPPQPGVPASLTFQNDCVLENGDKIDVNVICIR